MFQLSGLESVSASSFLLACFLPSIAVGQEDVFVDAAAFPIEFIARKSWITIAGILVFIMHLGAARLKSGLKQSGRLLVDGLSQSLGLQRSDVVGSSDVDVFGHSSRRISVGTEIIGIDYALSVLR